MEVKKKKGKTKYIVLAIFLLILVITYAFDYIRCTTYKIEVTASEMKPVASSSDDNKVDILVRVTRFGKVQVGHKIFALQTNGTLDKYVGYTDENGCVKFVYTPYNASAFTPAEPVEIMIRDESHSIIWEVNAYTTLVLDLQEP